jgi:protein involved in polysaccharide export with SLBB domain
MGPVRRWLKPFDQWRTRRSPWRDMAVSLAPALILLNAGLSACVSRSYEISSDGSAVYIDELSDAAKAVARENVVRSLTQGVSVYGLGLGDEVEIFFHINRKPTTREYLISPADKIRIGFLGDTESSRTIQVPPDGRIFLPLIGSAMAAGQTTDALARQLQERYSGILTEPQITVNVTETHSPVDDFLSVVAPSGKGRSILDKVLPDGTISVPLLPPLQARGRTLKDLEREIDAGYSAKGLNVFVSLVPHTLRSNSTLVIGEVGKPGEIELDQPTTVLMAVARAGGVLKTGSMGAVLLYYIGDDGVQRVRSINLTEVMDNLNLENDMVVPANSIIIVPSTELAKAGRFMDLVARDIFRFQGVTIGGSFQLQGGNTTNQVIIQR